MRRVYKYSRTTKLCQSSSDGFPVLVIETLWLFIISLSFKDVCYQLSLCSYIHYIFPLNTTAFGLCFSIYFSMLYTAARQDGDTSLRVLYHRHHLVSSTAVYSAEQSTNCWFSVIVIASFKLTRVILYHKWNTDADLQLDLVVGISNEEYFLNLRGLAYTGTFMKTYFMKRGYKFVNYCISFSWWLQKVSCAFLT